ncbi:MAG: hypothetical protein M0R33_12965 [Methylomonas sp.]|jgi:phage FluMu protein gp41|uniref:hypothetical protein n=1 Tax=Methylomonas sp. TaxID=418 RepID=UPI0025F7C303|nr:hypothetical protein [Methylomonas sp.]MCK9607346.1 hypothetical protein [Methylomonas sp.]
MKNILKITFLAAVILQSPSTIGAEIDLLCTGVEILGHSKTPYSFRILVNVETEKFTIFEDASNWSAGRKEYPKDNS